MSRNKNKMSTNRVTMFMALFIAACVGILWFMSDAQLEHLDLHYAEGSSSLYKLEINELEEVVRKNPKNFSAWELLGKKYREDKDFVKAKDAWTKALEVAHTTSEATRLKGRLDHIGEHHN